MIYLVGDIQGCSGALDRLLAEIGFSPSRDRLYAVGDLVNRGPGSLAALKTLRALGDAATCLLGNHDWHLLAAAAGVRPKHRSDSVDDILDAPDREAWLEWLRHRRMAVHEHGFLMLHAGVVPQWDVATTLRLAGELESGLRETPPRELLDAMFGNEPRAWRDDLDRTERLRFTLNVLTRIRFVDAKGALDFDVKESAAKPSTGLVPWFDAPGRRTASTPIAFGHWSSLGYLDRPDALGLDTGCVWGGSLTAVRLGADGARERISVNCSKAR